MAGEQLPTSGARGSNSSPRGFPNRSPCSLSAQIAPFPAESATKPQQDQAPHVASVCSLGCAPHKEGILEITTAEPFCLAPRGLALLFPRVGVCKCNTKHGAALASLPPAEHHLVWDAELGAGLLLRHNSRFTNQGK